MVYCCGSIYFGRLLLKTQHGNQGKTYGKISDNLPTLHLHSKKKSLTQSLLVIETWYSTFFIKNSIFLVEIKPTAFLLTKIVEFIALNCRGNRIIFHYLSDNYLPIGVYKILIYLYCIKHINLEVICNYLGKNCVRSSRRVSEWFNI